MQGLFRGCPQSIWLNGAPSWPPCVTFTTVKVFTSADSTNTYRYYDLDLAGFALTATFSVAFDAEMSSTGDYWFIDNIQVVGVRPQP